MSILTPGLNKELPGLYFSPDNPVGSNPPLSALEAGFRHLKIKPAPMLEANFKLSLYRLEHPDAQITNLTVGEPPLEPTTLAQMKDLMLGNNLEQIDLEETKKREIMAIAGLITTATSHMVKYSPKPGFKEVRDRYLQNSKGKYSDKELAVVSNGLSVPFEHIDDYIVHAKDKSQPAPTVILKQENVSSAINQIDHYQQAGHYVTLIINDSAKLFLSDPDIKRHLKDRIQKGKTFVVDILQDSNISDESIGLDTEVSDVVATVDISSAEQSGVSAVYSKNTNLAKYVLDRHANVHGTPSTTEQDFDSLLAFYVDPAHQDRLNALLSITEDDLTTVSTPDHGLMRNVIRLMQYAVRAARGDTQAQNMLENLKLTESALLADRMKNLYSEYYQDNVNYIMYNGAARKSIQEILEYYLLQGKDTTVHILSPLWSYDDLRQDQWKFHYLTDAFTPDEFRADFVLDEMDRMKKGDVLILPEGPHNSSGKIIHPEAMDRIVAKAGEMGIRILADQTYILYTKKEHPRYTAFQAADKIQRDGGTTPQIIGTVTVSKNTLAPGSRLAAILTNNVNDMNYFKGKRRNPEINPLGTFLVSSLISDKEKFLQLFDGVHTHVDQIMGLIQKIYSDRGFTLSEIYGGYYRPLPSIAMSIDPLRAQNMLAAKGVGVLSQREVFMAGPQWEYNPGTLDLQSGKYLGVGENARGAIAGTIQLADVPALINNLIDADFAVARQLEDERFLNSQHIIFSSS